jgi:acetyl-CoA C-acetyltransferase
VRTPFAKVDGPLGELDAIALSVPVVQEMMRRLDGATPDFAIWGTVVPNLTWSNIAREELMDAGVAPTVPAFSTVMAWRNEHDRGDRGRRNDRWGSSHSGAGRRRRRA